MKRTFEADGKAWAVWRSGGGAYGTGVLGPGNIDAVHFAAAEAPDTPLFEALVPVNAFESLYDDELIDLLRSARKIVIPEQIPQRRVSRRLGDQS